MHSSDPNLQDLSPEEKQAFNRAQNEALTFVVDQVLDEIPIVGEIKDIINGESIGTILLGIIPFAKKAKTVVEGVQDIKKVAKKVNPKKAAHEAGKKKREQQSGSEKRAKDYAKDLEKREGKDARRKAHDKKEKGKKNRTVKELKEDYKIKS